MTENGMNSWKQLGIGFSAVWILLWVGWTVDIYLSDDILIMPFVELALGIPLMAGLLGMLTAKTLRLLQRKKPDNH